MPSSTCLRGLSQLSLDATRTAIPSRAFLFATQASCFSTSSPLNSVVKKKKNMGAAPKKGARTLNVKRGKRGTAGADSGKRPSQGERRALRKRIVLSNNNALEVRGLQDLTGEDALNAQNEGKVKGIPEVAVDALRAVEAFKPRQGWSLFRRPAVLMRKETVQLARLMKDVEESAKGSKKTMRRILSGERMSGKSTLVLQGLMMAFLRKWTVVNLPEAQDIVNAHTDYAPLPGSQPPQYTQNTYTANILAQMIKANADFLGATPLTTKPEIPLPLPSKATLKQLAELGVANPDDAWPVFVALWKELTQPGRPPIMFAIDGLSHAMRNSEYLSANVEPIHAHDLTIVRHFVDLLSGKTQLPNGGVIIGANSGSNSPANPALDFSMQLAEARQSNPENMPKWNPYKEIDQRVMEVLKDVEVLKVSGVNKEEARAIMEYYAQSGMVRAQVNDNFINERWSLAGMGNIGELERATVRLRV